MDPDGLLAAGGDLSRERLIAAYSRGIFPWYSAGQPILWWSPDPRCVLLPSRFHASRSARKALRRNQASICFSLNHAFSDVIAACAERPNSGTWITEKMRDAFIALHVSGYAHSVEVWIDDTLAGGLYGLRLGQVFFGESMFSRHPGASRYALGLLCGLRQHLDIQLIDCQVYSDHLQSLGAQLMPREGFETRLRHLVKTSSWFPQIPPQPLAQYEQTYRLDTGLLT